MSAGVLPASVPRVDARDIIRLVGTASYQRAIGYAKGGAVSEIEWNPESGLLSSTVRGSKSSPYRCHIELAAPRAGFDKPVSGSCSCPMAGDCKHVAATLLECNAIHVRSGAVASGLVTALATSSNAPSPQAPPAVASWKTAMAALSAPTTGSPTTTAIALQFELREQTPRTRDRWRGPTAITATTVTEAGTYRLGVRPAVRSSAGNWVRGNTTWNSLAFQAHRLAISADHQRWFAQFVALYRSTTRDVYTGQDDDWIYLDDFHSALLWRLLEGAAGLGIPFIGSKKDATVRLGAQATVSLDASLESPDGTLALTPVVTIDGATVDPARAGLTGEHGVYLAELSPQRFLLAPTASPLSVEQTALVGRPASLVVPAADVEEFLTEYYPALRRQVEITSADATVSFPEINPPSLVLTVTFGKKQSLTAEWHFENAHATADAEFRWHVRGRVARALNEASAPAFASAAVPADTVVFAVEEPPGLTLSGIDAAEFVVGTLPALAAIEGVSVVEVGKRPDYRELTDVPKLVVTTVETEQRDWFDLGVLVSVDGRKVPFAPLFAALSKGHKKLLLVDNSYLSLDQPIFFELARLIEEASNLAEWETGAPRISRYQASLWADFEDLADETEQAASWRQAAAGLNAIESVEPTPLPAEVTASLRSYQLDGFNWLAFLWRQRLGGVLADDMGLGKTLQTLALIAYARTQAADERPLPFLVVAPTSVVSNWLSEAERFVPNLVVRGITATTAKSAIPLADQVAGADVIVTSYALFRLDFERYQNAEWGGLILDEAQFVKNPASKAHKAAVELRAPFKLAITGTPMENSLIDLWSLFEIVAPGLFPSHRRFTEDYVRPITSPLAGETTRASELLAQLRRRIRPLMMRRTKDLVATELPAKQEQVLRIDLSPRHRTLYDTFLQRERQKLLGLIDDMDKNRFIVFRSLTLLRMLSLDASLVDEKYSDIPSSKLDALFEQLDDVVTEGHRALVFSQFTSFLKKAAARLDAKGIAYEYLDGSTLKRADVISRFKGGVAPVFLISLKAGGFGLNLTEADYVFMLDPWWNPATESQAIDRTHRLGQTKSVMVYRLVANATIEEKVMALKEKKARLFDAVMDDDALFSSALTADDIRGLLE